MIELLAKHLAFLKLLRAMEETHVNRFAENVSLDRFHDADAGFKRICPRLDVDFRIQGIKLKRVMVPRPAGRRARSAIYRAGRAQLISAVLQLAPIGTPSGSPVALPGIFQTIQ